MQDTDFNALLSHIQQLSTSELRRLAAEIRSRIIETVSKNGGHLASNLGVVELTIALHKVFSTPSDAIIWDVGHQCYTHKILTGRYASFHTLRRKGGLAGFPKRGESPHDAFGTGHASTSISAALGMLAARKAAGCEASVAAVIGDGALTGGMAYEAMSHAGQLGLPLIVILNDNTMSISKNVGAISSYLSRLSATVRYQRVRTVLDKIILGVPYLGPRMHPLVLRMKRAVKAMFFKENLFSDLGFEYAGPIDGHNIHVLCEVLREAKAIRKPVVIHVVTKKGKGHNGAEENPSAFHGISPKGSSSMTFTEAFGKAVLKAAERDERITAVSAAMVSGSGLSEFQNRYPSRLYDVGIAEEHAVTFAAGLAAGGAKPVVALYSTFMQRAFDQILHDVALQDLPVVFAVDRAGAVPDDGETHQGIYDIHAFRAMPHIHIVAPADAVELENALTWALNTPHPVIIRYPKAACPEHRAAYSQAFETGKGVFALKTETASALIAASGALMEEALHAAALCASAGVPCDVYHLRFLKPFDMEHFLAAAGTYRYIAVAEEGVLAGSLAAEIQAALSAVGVHSRAFGFDEQPFSQASRAELLEQAGLSSEKLAAAIIAMTQERS